ncbi:MULTISPECIES: hypothetical protein [Tsukamurella]|uniref:Uncharacterized protein n=2 Tax=Tsukamurella TaxID=2060 RepID=A0A5C5S2P3_9ACTN|nr:MULTISPECIES: hypothetical protein [Tsukamurella]NMD56776.1 hypothetical protein [Tsukamurella columbiensis]TWS29687.1 hypothetical protein FK530_03845 [Tsukamurella conjunctivitidis]
MAVDDWPEGDRQWAGEYILGLFRAGVPAGATVTRQTELIAAAEAAGAPAVELFGDPGEAARADAPDLMDADAVAADADEIGLRKTLVYGGVALMFMGVIAAIMVVIDGAGAVDVTVGMTVVMVAIVAALLLGIAATNHFRAGRLTSAKVLAVLAVTAVVVGGSQVAWPGRDVILMDGLPRWAAALALLGPGVLAIIVGRMIPERVPQDSWTDEEWFDRFRGVLVSKQVSPAAAREHERSLRDGLAVPAFEEYGRPDVLALRLASEDPAAPSRRQWWGAAGWFAFAVLQATFIPGETGAWLVVRIAFTIGLLALAVRSALRARAAGPASRATA